eukprot:10499497-Alexandrium_andersonii.AAC.1
MSIFLTVPRQGNPKSGHRTKLRAGHRQRRAAGRASEPGSAEGTRAHGAEDYSIELSGDGVEGTSPS